jgi:hypothetical protein
MPNGSRSDAEEVIGHSGEGRPLRVAFQRKGEDGIRVLIVAGQHGDESGASIAARECLKRLEKLKSDAAIDLAVLADANPDGSASHTRRNRADADLNRDHLLLREPETLAIHQFVERWRPQVILDVHTYRPWRPELLRHDLVFPQDVMIDYPTNPATGLAIEKELDRGLLSFVKARMARCSLRCDRYTRVLASGVVRHSNLHIVDARNAFALRYGILTVLLEGRRSSPNDHPGYASTEEALLRAIEGTLEWAGREARTKIRASGQASGEIPVRCRYAKASKPRTMDMQSARDGDIRETSLPGDYLASVSTTRAVGPPQAYAVRRSAGAILELLRRQRFTSAPASKFRKTKAETYRVVKVPQFFEDGDFDDAQFSSAERVKLELEDFVIFPAVQPGSRMLSLVLEPESEFGLWRFAELIPSCEPGKLFPVARLE